MIKKIQHCPVTLKMCKINICKHKILDKKKKKAYLSKRLSWNSVLNIVIEFQMKKNLNFPCRTVKIGTEIMIQSNLYMHFLTLDEEQHSTMRNVPRKLFVYTSSEYSLNSIYWVLKWTKIYVNYTLYILLWLYLNVPFQKQMNIKKCNLWLNSW